MIKLTKNNVGMDGYYYQWGKNNFSRGLYLCAAKSHEIFGKQPEEIKAYGKNPKRKGQIKIVCADSDEHVLVNGDRVYVDYLITSFIKQNFDSDACWIVVK